MPLNVMKITVESPRIYAKQGVTISVTGLSEVRINGWNQDMLAVAFDNFLGKKEHEIEAIVKEKLEAQQSAIIRQMSIDEIYMDRRKFCTAFFNAASADLERIGISVLSYRLEEVSDEDGYLKALGEARCFHTTPTFIPGGRKFVFPVIQQVQRIMLNTMTITIESPRIYTQLGVPITVTGVAQLRIKGQNRDMLAAACEQFLSKSEQQIQEIAKETLEAHQRAIMGNMTVEEIYKDRKKFSKAVFEVASSDLVNMGISVVSYTLKDINDDEGYLKALGLARTAQVKRDARIGEAEAQKESGIKEAIAVQTRMASRYENEVQIAKAQRDFELKKAAFDKEVQAKKAESDLAYELQAAKTRQLIKEEEMQIKVVERTQQISVQELEIVRRERQLDASVRKPAEAERYRLERIAEAENSKIILEAQADAETVQLKGEAEAFAIEARAKATAEQMAKKADAWKEYGEAARLDLVLKALPKLAAEVAQPLASATKITMVSSGGRNAELGAAKITGEVMDIMERLPAMLQSMTGSETGLTKITPK
uniref:PHB domain-containing protein n=1 Tax=Macrostomum lignano TaxID=282301 RepID=A0A1I8GKQ6_9PLAT